MTRRRLPASWAAWIIGLPMAANLPAAPPPAKPSRTVVLDTHSFWRCHFTWRCLQVRRANGRLEYVSVKWPSRGPAKLSKADEAEVARQRTPAPPDGWTRADFDDGRWARARGPLFTRGTRKLALICARGKFTVANPAEAAPLELALAYRGGAIVYVNGKEIARGHLPRGPIDADTPAEDYPREAYLAPNGYQLRAAFREPEKYPDRFALRTRSLRATVGESVLRKGTNVVAVELHRAPVAEVFYVNKFRDSRHYYLWDMVGLEKLALTGPPGASGVTANVARPATTQVWNHPAWVSVHDTDYGDPAEPLRPIEIEGARNGAFSGQVVVGSTRAIDNLRAEVSDLEGGGGRKIAASAVLVRYAALGDHAVTHNESHRYRTPIAYERTRRRFDGLLESAPKQVAVRKHAGGAVVCVWVTVRVPPDAAAGDYAGTLTLAADSLAPTAVPVRLHVTGWALPKPTEFASHIGLIQSPESLAIRYGVEMWSEPHWKLIDRSFELLAQVGTKVVYLPLLARTYFGNEHSMVRWIRRKDGSYDHDFSIAERYVDTAVRHLGKVPVVCLYCWDVNTGSQYFGKRKTAEKAALPFTLLEAGTGKLTPATGPKWGDADVRSFWKPVLEGMRRLLGKRGLRGSMMVGIAGDRQPDKDAVEDLKAVAPEAPWVCSSHSSPRELFGQPVGYKSSVWGLYPAPDPSEGRYYGWKSREYQVAFPRAGSSIVGQGLRHRSALAAYRIAIECALTARGTGEGLRGIGRCGADFWPVLEGARGRHAVLGRFPETSRWHGGWLRNSTPFVLAAGPDGAVATARFEMLREGIQEAEARIFLEKALLDASRRAKLGEQLARRCRALLDRRVRVHLRAIAGGGRYLTWTWYAGSGIRRRTRQLYEAAAEVAAKSR